MRLAWWTSIPTRRVTAVWLVRRTCLTQAMKLHHFGWNACSSCLCPYAPHPHMERRYLIVPGINSSRIHILDTKPDPRQPNDREGDRARDGCAAHGLRLTAHGPLRTGRRLHERVGCARWERPRRYVRDGPRDIRDSWSVGDRPRPPATRIRRLVASGLRHHDHQRLGHAQHGEGWREPRAPAGREVRKQPARLGSPPPAPRAGA